MNLSDKALAASGLMSYRAKGPFGWIMIGARYAHEAWAEACRSTEHPTDLQMWDGERYIPLHFTPPQTDT